MIWGISCLQFCKKSADHKEGNTCSEVPIINCMAFNFTQLSAHKYAVCPDVGIKSKANFLIDAPKVNIIDFLKK